MSNDDLNGSGICGFGSATSPSTMADSSTSGTLDTVIDSAVLTIALLVASGTLIFPFVHV